MTGQTETEIQPTQVRLTTKAIKLLNAYRERVMKDNGIQLSLAAAANAALIIYLDDQEQEIKAAKKGVRK